VVSLVAYTGMRFGELTGLNVEDVDLKARRIRVRRSITQDGGKLVEGNPKSSAGRRSMTRTSMSAEGFGPILAL
jgi:integrase